MYTQFFGNYLLSRGTVTGEQLIHALQRKAALKIKFGTLAIHAGYLTANEVDRIITLQTHQDRLFGEIAISEGYLTEAQVSELLRTQRPDFLLLGQALIEDGILTNEQFQDLIIDYQSENELLDFDYSAETIDSINHMVENFFVLAERALSPMEVTFIRLLLNNLIRFIGDDFTLVPPSQCHEYPTNYCVSQKTTGSISVRTYLDMPQSACIDFASRYVGESFTDFNEYVQASLEDFLNLHNALFLVNMSNDHSIELGLEPPTVEADELISYKRESYMMPVVYPFGIVHFVFELFSIM